MIQNKIICPKCQTRNLRKSHGINPMGEMFCDKDHEYMTIWELVNIWGYDAGDFINQNNISLVPINHCNHEYLVNYPPFIPEIFVTGKQCMDCFEIIYNEKKSKPVIFDTLSMFEGEPIWKSNQEREEAYEIVHRMFEGIPEYDDLQDLKNTQEWALDRGVQ